MHIEILRLGHRLPRDERISTHVALVARAFGATSIAYSGQHDSGLEDSVKRICERWGSKASSNSSDFSIAYERSAVPYIKSKRRDGFIVVHLTMYGMPLIEKVDLIRSQGAQGKILVVVGSEQVPPEIYQLADYNVSVTSQPHSEVAALAITLDRLTGGEALGKAGLGFDGSISIIPSERGKNVKGR